MRLLAECNFSLGRGEQAARYYERMMTEHADELTSQDLRNVACSYWLIGERERCFKCLRRAEDLFDGEEDRCTFAAALSTQLGLLQKFSAHKEELTYFYDAYCRYKKR